MRVIAGADPQTGEILKDVNATFGSDMRELADGVSIAGRINIPGPWIMKAYKLLSMYDYPARGVMTPFSISTSAHQFCHSDHYDRSNPTVSPCAVEFIPTAPAAKLRTLVETQRVLKAARSLSSAAAKAHLKKNGCRESLVKSSCYCANDPKYFPGHNYVDGAPEDGMHLNGDGVAKPELCGTIAVHIRKGFYDLAEVCS